MRRLFLDFETYYTLEYSLKRLSTEAYCRDPRFEIILVGTAEDSEPPTSIPYVPGLTPRLLRERVESVDEVVCHNASFDGYILESVLRVKAKRLACTRTMTRWTGLGRTASQSLGSLAEVLDIGRKGDTLAMSLGKRQEDFSPVQLAEFADYNRQDVELTRKVFDHLRPLVTDEAMEFMSMTLKMYTDPWLELDVARLREYRNLVLDRQEADQDKLQRLFKFDDREAFLKALRSADSFCGMLRELGVEPPTKVTEASERAYARARAEVVELAAKLDRGEFAKADMAKSRQVFKVLDRRGRIPALAKDDQGFRDLMEHPDPDVALLAGLRAENNSPIGLSRVDTFLEIAKRGPVLPIPLAAWGAHTGRYAAGTGHRDSESDRTNLQNLPKRKGDTALRTAVKAPKGYALVSGDSAQIEARVGAWLAGQDDLVATFARGDDPYVEMAEAIYGESAEVIRKGAKEDHVQKYVTMRDVGKTTMLSSQYGIGAAKFSQYLLRNGLRLAPALEDHEAKAAEINNIYNHRYSTIANFRRTCHLVARWMLDPSYESEPWTRAGLVVRGTHPIGGVYTAPAIILPNSFPLVYPKLRQEDNNLIYSLYKVRGRWEDKRLYGGALFNNITQGLAFAILAWQGVELSRKLTVSLNVHDEWVCVAPVNEADESAAFMRSVLTATPPWTPGLPLGCDVRISESFA